MKIILNEKIDSLGDAGQIVSVKSGYARNFLIPRGLAAIATETNIKQAERMIKDRIENIDLKYQTRHLKIEIRCRG